MAARIRTVWRNALHKSRQRSQNSPPRNGNNRITADFVDDKQRQELINPCDMLRERVEDHQGRL